MKRTPLALLAACLLAALPGCSDSLTGTGPDGAHETAWKGKPPKDGGDTAFSLEAAIKSIGKVAVSEQPPAASTAWDLTYNNYPANHGPDTFFGCPDATRECSEITVTVRNAKPGTRFGVRGSPVSSDVSCQDGVPAYNCMTSTIANSSIGWIYMVLVAPSFAWEDMVPVNGDDAVRSYTFHWQGQRMNFSTAMSPEAGTNYRNWTFVPDLPGPAPGAAPGTDDYHFFSFAIDDGGQGTAQRRIDDQFARYAGSTSATPAYLHRWVTLAPPSTRTTGKGKNQRTETVAASATVEFAAFPFMTDETTDFTDPAVGEASLAARPGLIVEHSSSGYAANAYVTRLGVGHGDDRPGIDITGFTVPLEQGDGTYTFRVAGVVVDDPGITSSPTHEYAWDGSTAREVQVCLEGDAVTEGACN